MIYFVEIVRGATKRVITNSREKLLEMAEQKNEVQSKEKEPARSPLDCVPEYRGSDHVLLTIDTATSLQVHGAKSLMRMKSNSSS